MATLVMTVIGDDRSGLVDSLAEVIAENGGSWERSQMARLGGKFAGLVVVGVPDRQVAALTEAVGPLSERGLLDVTVETTTGTAEPGDAGESEPVREVTLHLVGHDRPGLVHRFSSVLAEAGVSIVELATEVASAPMSGEVLFTADAVLDVPTSVDLAALARSLESLAGELMVDLDLVAAPAD